jgi:hypothetical protein
MFNADFSAGRPVKLSGKLFFFLFSSFFDYVCVVDVTANNKLFHIRI